MIYALLIISKSGGLIFHKFFKTPSETKESSQNLYLRLSSTLHGLYEITKKISPVKNSSGIQVIEADTFAVHCFQTLTGVKFVAVTDKTELGDFLSKRLYEIYSDYVMKDPFYDMDQPIRSDRFEHYLQKLINEVNK